LAVSQAESIRRRRNDENIIVTTIEEVPYLEVKDTGSGNDRYTGFIPELMKEIAKEKNLKYEFRLVADNKYGRKKNDGDWNGMIGELEDNTAQLAAAPLTISDERKRAVEFTEPFMDLGTVMLTKKPKSGEYPVDSFEDLVKQTDIKYGVVKDGFTMSFFQNSQDPTYKKVWEHLNNNRDTAMLKSNIDGVEKVREGDGKYIFIMENSTASYWMNQEPCDLLVIGKPISNRHYGFATKSKGQLNTKVSDAIKKLKQNGKLEELERTWWKKDAQCNSATSSISVGFLTLTLGALSLLLTRY